MITLVVMLAYAAQVVAIWCPDGTRACGSVCCEGGIYCQDGVCVA